MYIRWRGWGIAVLGFFLAALLGLYWLVGEVYDAQTRDRYVWAIMAAALVISGFASLVTGVVLNRGRPRVRECCHSLYECPMEWWGVALPLAGGAVYLAHDDSIPWSQQPWRILAAGLAICGIASLVIGLVVNRVGPRHDGGRRRFLDFPSEWWGAALLLVAVVLFVGHDLASPWGGAEPRQPPGKIVITRTR